MGFLEETCLWQTVLYTYVNQNHFKPFWKLLTIRMLK